MRLERRQLPAISLLSEARQGLDVHLADGLIHDSRAQETRPWSAEYVPGLRHEAIHPLESRPTRCAVPDARRYRS